MLLFFAVSCEFSQQYQHAEKFTMDDFKKKIDLSGIELIDESILYKPVRLYLVNDSILVMQNLHSENHFFKYNLHRKEAIGECIPFGSGPGEMIAPKYFQQIDTLIWIYDAGKNSMIACLTHDFCAESNPEPVFVIKFEEQRLDAVAIGKNEQIISTVLSSDLERLCFFDKEGQLSESKGVLPDYGQNLTVVEFIESFLCNIAVNPNTGYICLPYKRTDLIEFYDSTGLLLKRIHGPDHFFPVLTQINRDNTTGIRSIEGKTRDGYFSPFATKNEIYILYSGKYFNRNEKQYLSNQIFTFDWDGNSQNNYLLDIPIFNFVVDERQNKIYGITDDPEFRIIEFQL
jgi:hypothetical protein